MDINAYDNNEKELETEFEEFEEDFEIAKPGFEVWAFGYDAYDRPTGFEFRLFVSDNPDEAVERAERFVESESAETIAEFVDIPSDVAYLGVEVEEAVEVEGVETNQGSIYRGNILIKEN